MHLTHLVWEWLNLITWLFSKLRQYIFESICFDALRLLSTLGDSVLGNIEESPITPREFGWPMTWHLNTFWSTVLVPLPWIGYETQFIDTLAWLNWLKHYLLHWTWGLPENPNISIYCTHFTLFTCLLSLLVCCLGIPQFLLQNRTLHHTSHLV